MKKWSILIVLVVVTLVLVVVATVPAAVERATEFTRTEITLSEYYRLTPADIRAVETIRHEGRLDGFVVIDNLTVYEILALSTTDETRLRQLAQLHLAMDQQVIDQLKRYGAIFREEAKR